MTGPGALAASHQVRHILHVASVEGRPGEGFSQVPDVGRCVRNGLAAAERLRTAGAPARTVLFPLLGVGVAGAPLMATVRAMRDAAIEHLRRTPDTHLRVVYFLAFTDIELATLEQAMLATPGLVDAGP